MGREGYAALYILTIAAWSLCDLPSRENQFSRLTNGRDPKLKGFTLSKPLVAGLTYPYDWGFVPYTKAADGDPLDVLILHDAATYPGLIVQCRPIGILEVMQTTKGKKERNNRLFAFTDRSTFKGDPQDVRDLPKRAIEELEKFFKRQTHLRTRNWIFLGGVGRAEPSRAFENTRSKSPSSSYMDCLGATAPDASVEDPAEAGVTEFMDRAQT